MLRSATSSPRPTCTRSLGGVGDGQWGGGLEGGVRLGRTSRSSLGVFGSAQMDRSVQMGGNEVGVVGGEHQRGGSVVGAGQMGRSTSSALGVVAVGQNWRSMEIPRMSLSLIAQLQACTTEPK